MARRRAVRIPEAIRAVRLPERERALAETAEGNIRETIRRALRAVQ